MKPSKKNLERDLEHARGMAKDLAFRLLNGTHLSYKEVQDLKEAHETWSKTIIVLSRKVAKAS